MARAHPATGQRDDWESHWEEYAESAERNPAQQLRRTLIARHLGALDATSRVVDIGCGQGDLLRDLHARFPNAALLGVDHSGSGLSAAAQKVPSARFVRSDLLEAESIPEDVRGWATHAICSEVIEHVDNPALLLSNASTLLSSGGTLVVTVPGGPMSAYDRHIGHRTHYTADSLRRVLLDAGYEPSQIRRAGFPTFNAYKLMVIARGDRLVDDAKRSDSGDESKLASLVMSTFRPLFRLTVRDSRWGWQLVAIARPRG
jgi:trans-aconitate methyltransferase